MATVFKYLKHESKKNVDELIKETKNIALLHGVLMRTAEQPSSSEKVNYAPFTLFPTLVPSVTLEKAKDVQKNFNILMHKVAHDHDFLYNCLQNVIKVDDFTKRLWDIYCKVREEGMAQPMSLGLFRNDFMMDVKIDQTNSSVSLTEIAENIQLKQIEFNTIASSFGGLVGQLTNVHRYSVSRMGVHCSKKELPNNDPALGLAKGLLQAWKHYNNKRASILYIASEKERNKMDQCWLEQKLFELDSSVTILYKKLSDLSTEGHLTSDKRLLINGEEIAVIYFRDGYVPDSYKSPADWEARLMMERSLAIKSPSVHYQLAGTKKVQQELARPGAVEKFITKETDAANIRSFFAGQFSLDLGTDDGDKAVNMAINSPGKFVLKPQREGGGNNLYDDEIKELLLQIQTSEERSAYILMEKIHPWVQSNYLMKFGEDTGLRNVVSEIGIYGVVIGSKDDIIINEEVGHLMRTKTHGVNEGGISAGFAVLDTPYLIDLTF